MPDVVVVVVVAVAVAVVVVSVPVVDEMVVVVETVVVLIVALVVVAVTVVTVTVEVVAVTVVSLVLVADVVDDTVVVLAVDVVSTSHSGSAISTPAINGLYPFARDNAASTSRVAAAYSNEEGYCGFASGPAKIFQRGDTAMPLLAIWMSDKPAKSTLTNGTLTTNSNKRKSELLCCASTSMP